MKDGIESTAPQTALPPGLDLARICRHMSRTRGFANGFVRVAEGKVKQWEAVWYEYLFVDGRERRRQRTKIVGKKSDLTKREAEDAARELARGARPPERDATFADLAQWYLRTKEASFRRNGLARSEASLNTTFCRVSATGLPQRSSSVTFNRPSTKSQPHSCLALL